MDPLLAKIHAEIDTDERLANGEDEQAHNERHSPDRIERQAAAFRTILELHRPHDDPHELSCAECGTARVEPISWPCPTAQALADIYKIEHA